MPALSSLSNSILSLSSQCKMQVTQELNVAANPYKVQENLFGRVGEPLGRPSDSSKQNQGPPTSLEIVAEGDGLDNVVSSTSRSFAAYRAIESERPDALFHDPLAEYLAGEAALNTQRQQIAAGSNPGVRFAVRTKYFDEALMSAIGRIKSAAPKSKIQSASLLNQDLVIMLILCPEKVVFFGCGMDARAWRLPEASASDMQTSGLPKAETGNRRSDSEPPAEIVFEGDRADVIELKRQLLDKLESDGKLLPLRLSRRRAMLPIDLNEPTWQSLLVREGFRPSEPTVWLFEGLVMYLNPAAVVDLLEATSILSAPGSVLLVSGISDVAVQRGKQSKSPVRRSFTWGCGEPDAFFNQHGWHVQKVDDVTGGMFGRILPTLPGREPYLTWYLTAVKL